MNRRSFVMAFAACLSSISGCVQGLREDIDCAKYLQLDAHLVDDWPQDAEITDSDGEGVTESSMFGSLFKKADEWNEDENEPVRSRRFGRVGKVSVYEGLCEAEAQTANETFSELPTWDDEYETPTAYIHHDRTVIAVTKVIWSDD